MRTSYRWLKELTGIDESPETYAEVLTDLGLEVDEVHRFTAPAGVVVAHVRSMRPHPKRDKLRLVTIDDGEGEKEIVCGAPNVPDPGHGVLFARLGAKLPLEDGGFFEIAEKAIGGVPSAGMLCSETELGIGVGTEGIFVFEGEPPAAGTPLAEALPCEDVAFELGITPNRPDALGHLGVARDLCARFGVPFQRPALTCDAVRSAGAALVGEAPIALFEAGDALDEDVRFTLAIEDAERCPRYGAAFVRGAAVRPSPFWVRHRLFVLGVRSISNLVDATNLVMLETGHPIHGFDHDRLRGSKIVVRAAKEGETMVTLDDVERTLTTDDLLICDGEGPVAIAGVMGGADSEIGDATTNVVIECAYFDPRSVRRTSKRVGLHTDASHRFERGVDWDDVPWVMKRAAALMVELGGGVAIAQAHDLVAKPMERRTIRLRHKRVEALLGLAVAPADARKALEALEVKVSAEDDEGFDCVAPSHRPDLAIEEDLVEEVGRVRGYDLVPTEVPAVRPSREASTTGKRLAFERHLREIAASSGLLEAVSMSFVAPEDHTRARVDVPVVAMQNPMSVERSVMRATLLPGLAHAASRSLRRQVDEVALFEVGRVFRSREGQRYDESAWGDRVHDLAGEDDALPLEHPYVAVMVAGDRSGWIGAPRDVDFYDLKGHVDEVVRRATGRMATWQRPDPERTPVPGWLHPRRGAEVFLGEVSLGFAGELHPAVRDDFEIEARAAYAELDLFRLFEARGGVGKAVSPPKVPAVTRDVALLVAEDVEAGAVADCLRAGAGGLAEDVTVFDVYRGQELGEGQKSLAFRIRYRHPEETLTDKKVDKLHAKAVRAAQDRFDATVR